MSSELAKQKTDLFGLGTTGKNGGLVAIERGQGNFTDYKLPEGVISCNKIIPVQVQQIMQAQFKSVGLDFDCTKLALNKDNRQALAELRQTVDLIKNNAAILPALAKELKAAMKAATKQAEFNADMVKESLKQQHKIDSAQADILMALAGYQSKSQKLAAKLERKLQKLQAVQKAQQNHYNATHGKELESIDANWELITSVKLEKIEANKRVGEQQTKRQKNNIAWREQAGVKQ